MARRRPYGGRRPVRRPRRRSACLLAAGLAAALLSVGCTIFPHGGYWPSAEGPLSRVPATDEAERPAAQRAKPGEGRAALPRALRQADITCRWSGEDLARSARRMNGWAGRCVYADAVRTLVWYYVDRISYRRLVVAGLESLRAALENPAFRKRFLEASDADKRARFAEALEILTLKARAANPWFAFQAADWLAVTMEKNRAMLGLPDGAVVAEFLFGAMDDLDPYTRFLTPEMLRRERLERAYAGIGVAIVNREGRFFIERVLAGGPAAGAGLKEGDEILAVDGHALADMSLADVSGRVRGKPGTSVTLTVRSGDRGPPRKVTLVRQMIHVRAVEDARMVDPDRRVGYVRLRRFSLDAPRGLRRAVAALLEQDAKALILDLRGNPGGSLLSALGVAGVFLRDGRVVETRGRTLGATWTYNVPLLARQAWKGPLAILVNERTASASEIVASALAQHGRATLVGQPTFGKGAVQIRLPVDWGNSAVSITIARAYDLEDKCLEGRGVAPDVRAIRADGPVGALRDDPTVRAAVEALGNKTGAP